MRMLGESATAPRPAPARAPVFDQHSHHFRELWVPIWSEAFRDTVQELTGASTLSYRVAVTKLRGGGAVWSFDPTIRKNLGGCSVGFLRLEEMWDEMLLASTTRPAANEMGRLTQLLKAADVTT
jgi:hypothetical protein